nr:2657_t:CDS:2 [Entrophospora candida]
MRSIAILLAISIYEGFGVKTARDVTLKVKKDSIELTSTDFKNSHITEENKGDYTTFLMDKIVINIPALNKLNGKAHPAEVNFVYKKERNGPGHNPNNLAILTTLYKFGKFGGSPFWDVVIKALKKNKKIDVLKFKNLLDITDSNKGFNYDGTLTSPPCTPVEWFISSQIHAIGIPQFRALKAAMKKR